MILEIDVIPNDTELLDMYRTQITSFSKTCLHSSYKGLLFMGLRLNVQKIISIFLHKPRPYKKFQLKNIPPEERSTSSLKAKYSRSQLFIFGYLA